jgi:hypothetical protein
MIWYILLACLVYFTITIVAPVVLYRMGIIRADDIKGSLGVWIGILWPVSLSIILLGGSYKVIRTLIQKFANVK